MKNQVGTSRVREITLSRDELNEVINSHVRKMISTTDGMDYDRPVITINGICSVKYFELSIKTRDEDKIEAAAP